MRAEHGLPADVFMMSQTIWQIVSNHLRRVYVHKYFAEGQGLHGYDFEQVSNPANNRLHTEATQAMRIFHASLPNIYPATAVTDEFATELTMLVCRGLQAKPSERPTMSEMRAQLEQFWRQALQLEEKAPDATLQPKTRDSQPIASPTWDDPSEERRGTAWGGDNAGTTQCHRAMLPSPPEDSEDTGFDYVKMSD
jgi:hypothetical protein